MLYRMAMIYGVLCATLHSQEETPLFERQPYLQNLTSVSVVVVSESMEKCIASIEYGLEGEDRTFLREEEAANDHAFSLDSLIPGKKYAYRVTHEGFRVWPQMSFQTFPEAKSGGEGTVGVIGDSGYGENGARDKLAAILDAISPQAMLHTGDVVYPMGVAGLYQYQFFDVYTDLLSRACVFPTLGNNDCQISIEYWLKIFSPTAHFFGDGTNYSFDMGDGHFVALNSCGERFSPQLLEWLETGLSNDEHAGEVVYFHHPPHSNVGGGSILTVRETIVPMIQKYHVDLVLSGHSHGYERFYPLRDGEIRDGFQDPEYVFPEGTVYVVTAGGGAKLYGEKDGSEKELAAKRIAAHHALLLNISETELEITAIGLEAQPIDRCVIRKGTASKPLLRFLRADADQSGVVDISDGIAVIGYLFLGAKHPCLASSDANSSGSMNIADAVYIL